MKTFLIQFVVVFVAFVLGGLYGQRRERAKHVPPLENTLSVPLAPNPAYEAAVRAGWTNMDQATWEFTTRLYAEHPELVNVIR